MELRQLRYFIAVAEEENFGAAAKRVNVSQPPISRQIHALEAELGVKLFLRTSRGSSLTEAGQVLLEEAREIVGRAQKAAERSRAADKGDIGSMKVGFFGSPIYCVLPDLLRSFRKRVPSVQIALTCMPKSRQIEALRSGAIEIGFSRYFVPAPDVAVETVIEESLYVAVPSDHRLAEELTVEAADLANHPLITFPNTGRPSFADEALGILLAAGTKPNIRSEADDVTCALALVAAGEGPCLVPESVTSISLPGVVFIPLADPHLKSAINCAYLKSNHSPILKRFLATIRERRERGSNSVTTLAREEPSFRAHGRLLPAASR